MAYKKYMLYFLAFVFCCSFIGCATAPYTAAPKPKGGGIMPGIYHRAEKGQTLWRISKIYSVDLDDLARANNLTDAAHIEAGQLIFIPHRQKQPYAPTKSVIEDFIWPVRGKVIAGFGQTFNDMVNKGINIQGYKDSTVVSARSGRAVFCDNNFKDFGKTIIIDHGDGFSTVYARNSEVFVKAGDYVKRGTVIARAGSSNTDKDIYLHFEIRKGHIPQNPYFYLP